MATQMQIRGGTTAENLIFTGAQREVTYDTDKNTLIGHDGVTAGGFPLATEKALADGTIYYNDDIPGGSSANAYILVPKPNTNAPNAYLDGIEFGFVTTQPNTGPSTANFQGLGAKSIKYPGGVDPAPGDVFGRVDLVFDLANDWLELQRKPADAPPQIRSIAGVSSGNALVITLQPATIDFRSNIPSNGAIVSRFVPTAIGLTVPAGATLGTVSGVQSRIVVLAIDNGGTVELAVVNLAGGVSLDETGLINTAVLNAASNSASTIYSQGARSNVAYRVMGYVQSTQAAAGTWSSSPTQVQGQGGQTIISSDKPLDRYYESAPLTMTAGSTLNLTHGLGGAPILMQMEVTVTTAFGGYSVGDRIVISPSCSISGVNGIGPGISSTTTGIVVSGPAQSFSIINKAGTASIAVPLTSVTLKVRAWL